METINKHDTMIGIIARFQYWNWLFSTNDHHSVLRDCDKQFKLVDRGSYNYVDKRGNRYQSNVF